MRHAIFLYDETGVLFILTQLNTMLPTWYKFILKGVFYLFQVFGLFFPSDFINLTIDDEYKRLKRSYAVFIAITLVITYAYSTWCGIVTVFKVLRTSSIILLMLLYTSLTFVCLIFILSNVFWNREYWCHYVKLQKVLKEKLNLKQPRNKIHFTLELVLGHFLFLLVVVIDQWRHWVEFNQDLSQIIPIILKDALFYYIFLITLIVYNMTLFLRNDLCLLKTYLTDTVTTADDRNKFILCKSLGTDVVFPRITIGNKTLPRLMETSKMLNILFECVEIFNRIFGIVILLISFCTVLAILVALNTLVITGETDVLTAEVVLNCLSEALIFTVWNFSIISACGLLKYESELLVKLCCKLQHILPQSSQERRELLNLAHQINRKSFTISAFGFFRVDFSLIFSIFSYVGTYIVVLIQFSHMDF